MSKARSEVVLRGSGLYLVISLSLTTNALILNPSGSASACTTLFSSRQTAVLERPTPIIDGGWASLNSGLDNTDWTAPSSSSPSCPSHRPQGPSEYELGMGRCIDALRSDFPEFFDRELDWQIYTKDVEIRDPTGVQVQGLAAYKQIFTVIRLFRRVMIDDVSVRYRLRYDCVRQRVIVQWYTEWRARGAKTPGHVSGVSHFHLDHQGRVARHEIDKILVNSDPVNPPNGWLAFRQYVLAGLDRPVAPVPCLSRRLDPLPLDTHDNVDFPLRWRVDSDIADFTMHCSALPGVMPIPLRQHFQMTPF